jgi:hypothetical protein
MGNKRNVYGVFVRKTEGEEPLGRVGLGCEKNIKIGLS